MSEVHNCDECPYCMDNRPDDLGGLLTGYLCMHPQQKKLEDPNACHIPKLFDVKNKIWPDCPMKAAPNSSATASFPPTCSICGQAVVTAHPHYSRPIPGSCSLLYWHIECFDRGQQQEVKPEGTRTEPRYTDKYWAMCRGEYGTCPECGDVLEKNTETRELCGEMVCLNCYEEYAEDEDDEPYDVCDDEDYDD